MTRGLLNHSLYSPQIYKFLSDISFNNFMLIKAEDLFHTPNIILNDIITFLN